MKRTYLLVLTLLLPALLIAQSNYKNGLVVNLKGDTVRGLINYKEWGKNPVAISFKQNPNDNTPKGLGLNDIKYFEIPGFEYYQSYNVSISQGTNDLNRISGVEDTTTKTDVVFLRILQKGKNVTLLSYNDDIKMRYYLLDKTMSVPQELTYRVHLNPDALDKQIINNSYRSQLYAAAERSHKESAGLLKQIGGIDYSERELIKIATAINDYTSDRAASDFKKRNALKLYIGLSVIANTLEYEGDKAATVLVGKSSTSISPKLAFGLDSYINPNVGRTILRAELSVFMANYNFNSTGVSGNGFTNSTIAQQVKQINVAINAGLIYNFYNSDAFKFYGGAGIAANFAPSNKNNVQTITPTSTVTGNIPTLESFWVSFPIKVGLVFGKKIDLGFTYQPASVATFYDAFAGYITAYQFGVNYSL